MRPASFALRSFQAPLDQFADIALVLENVENFWRLGRWLVWIERLVQLVLRTNRRHRPSGRQFLAVLEGCKGCFASRNVIPGLPTPRIIPDQTHSLVLAPFLLLPNH